MKPPFASHLSREQLLSGVVDATDLPPALQNHLADCPQCRLAASHIERELEVLGRAAHRYVPATRKPMTVPQERSRSRAAWLRQWGGSVAMAATALLLIFFVWGSGRMGGFQADGTRDLALEDQEAETLIRDIRMLLDESIPQVYLEICADSELEFDDTFVEYIMPVGEDSPPPLISERKGVELC